MVCGGIFEFFVRIFEVKSFYENENSEGFFERHSTLSSVSRLFSEIESVT